MNYLKNSLLDPDSNKYFTVESLIEIYNIITGSSNITLRKFHVKKYVLDDIKMDKDLIEYSLLKIRD